MTEHIKIQARLFSQIFVFSTKLVKISSYRVFQPDMKTHWTSKIHKMLYWHSYILVLSLVQAIPSLSSKVPPPKLLPSKSKKWRNLLICIWFEHIYCTQTDFEHKASRIRMGKTSGEQRHSANDDSLSAW